MLRAALLITFAFGLACQARPPETPPATRSSGEPSRQEAPTPDTADLALPTPRETSLATDESAYAPGDSLALLLFAAEPLEYNLCGARLERLEGPAWVPVREEYVYLSEEDRRVGAIPFCPDIAYRVEASNTARYAVRLSDALPPGTYRLSDVVRPVEVAGSGRPERAASGQARRDTLFTPPFQIRP
ncbi:MAG: hypothetical protein ABJF88_11520 [Rhodothermales bacterium]